MAPIRIRIGIAQAHSSKRRTYSGFFFLLDRLADDVGHVGVAFFLFLDEGGIVEALVAISTSSSSPAAAVASAAAGFLPCCSASASSSETNSASAVSGTMVSVGATGAGRAGCCRFRPRARRRRRGNRYNFARIGRNHRRLVEIVKFTTGIGTDALGAEIGFSHSRGSSGQGRLNRCFTWLVAEAPVNSASALRRCQKRRDDGARGCVVGRRRF